MQAGKAACMSNRSALEICLLGRFVVRRGGQELPAKAFGGRLARMLLRLLVSQRGRFFSKDLLAEALWAERPPADPSGNLEVLVSRIRRALADPTLILTGPGGYAFTDEERCAVDIEVLRSNVQAGRTRLAVGEMAAALDAFINAVDAWGGEPLPEDAYADWAQALRTELRRLQLEALEGGAEAALAVGDPDRSVQMAEMAVVREPLRERPHLLLVKALAAAADRAGALRAFDDFRRRFAEELGLDPSPEAWDLQGRILRGDRSTRASGLERLAQATLAGERRDTGLGIILGGRGSGPMRARALASMAMLAAGSDDYERGGRLAELALFEAADEPGARAEALLAAAIVGMNRGLLDGSQAALNEARDLFEDLGDQYGLARVLDVRAMQTFLEGHIRDGVDQFDRAARLFEDSGDLMRVVTPRSTRGHGLVFMARPDDGLRDIEEALELARVLGDEENESYCLWHRSEALAALGRASEALSSARQALELAERLNHHEWTAASLRGLGIAAEAAADPVMAEASFRRPLELSEGMPVFKGLALARLALVLTKAGRFDEARPLVELALAGGTPFSAFEARLAQAELAAAEGRPEQAIARQSLAMAEREGHLQSAARLRQLLSPL